VVEERAGWMPGPSVERLTRETKGELTQALTEAFVQHPLLHGGGGHAEDAGALMREFEVAQQRLCWMRRAA
jgi:hypothetical protein